MIKDIDMLYLLLAVILLTTLIKNRIEAYRLYIEKMPENDTYNQVLSYPDGNIVATRICKEEYWSAGCFFGPIDGIYVNKNTATTWKKPCGDLLSNGDVDLFISIKKVEGCNLTISIDR
jgi:hypothetical protein